jgi:hypothetical protein
LIFYAVEGTKQNTGAKGSGCCDVCCPYCERDTFGVPDNRVSLCAHCGAELFPCEACNDGCDWSGRLQSCHRFMCSTSVAE